MKGSLTYSNTGREGNKEVPNVTASPFVVDNALSDLRGVVLLEPLDEAHPRNSFSHVFTRIPRKIKVDDCARRTSFGFLLGVEQYGEILLIASAYRMTLETSP